MKPAEGDLSKTNNVIGNVTGNVIGKKIFLQNFHTVTILIENPVLIKKDNNKS